MKDLKESQTHFAWFIRYLVNEHLGPAHTLSIHSCYLLFQLYCWSPKLVSFFPQLEQLATPFVNYQSNKKNARYKLQCSLTGVFTPLPVWIKKVPTRATGSHVLSFDEPRDSCPQKGTANELMGSQDGVTEGLLKFTPKMSICL